MRPKLSIIIPMKGKISLITQLLLSIYYHCGYDRNRMDIILADTGSSDVEKKLVKFFIGRLKRENNMNCKMVEYDYYNFSKINNDVVNHHISDDTELILFMNNDMMLINDAISMAVDTYERNKEDVGTVGIRLMYADNTVQHAGIDIVYYTKFTESVGATHYLIRKPFIVKDRGEVTTCGNTGAFMLVSRKDFISVGGFNEEYEGCFEDVEFNMQMLLKGRRNITNIDAICFHYESATRGRVVNKTDVKRLQTFILEKPSLKKVVEDIRKREPVNKWIRFK